VLWRKNGPPTDLGYGVAASINNRGEVTGGSPVSEHEVHGFLRTSELGTVDLGTVGHDASSFPTMINNSGQITGGSCDQESNCRAFLWDSSATTMVDLNELTAEGSGLHLIFASWINEAGDVVGQAVDTKTGDLHAFLATPIRGGSTATVTSAANSAPLPGRAAVAPSKATRGRASSSNPAAIPYFTADGRSVRKSTGAINGATGLCKCRRTAQIAGGGQVNRVRDMPMVCPNRWRSLPTPVRGTVNLGAI
jgi:probable HAF family extracellular repeat protein